MQITCPQCRIRVPVANIALDTGWAKCDSCNEVFRLADIVEGYQAGQAPSAIVERPFDAWAKLERTPRQLGIVLPPHGMRAAAWGLLGFAAFWLLFIAFWTAGALRLFFGQKPAGAIPLEQIIFASFSAPFWVVGVIMLGSVLWMSRGSVSVYLDAGQAYLERRCLIYRRVRRLSRGQIQCARPCAAVVKPDNSTYLPHAVEIVFESGSFKIPCTSKAEEDWLIAEVNEFLKTVAYSPSPDDLLSPNRP